jgi:hypothetical protein
VGDLKSVSRYRAADAAPHLTFGRQASQIFVEVFMSTEGSDFDQSVWEIVGLSTYEPKRLPAWLRDKLDGWWCPPELTTDEDVVGHQFGRFYIGEWGTAVINQQEAFIWETDGDDWYGDHFQFADTMDCGLVLVEPSSNFDVWTTALMFRSRFQRRRAD